jgi:hypothetical protein
LYRAEHSCLLVGVSQRCRRVLESTSINSPSCAILRTSTRRRSVSLSAGLKKARIVAVERRVCRLVVVRGVFGEGVGMILLPMTFHVLHFWGGEKSVVNILLNPVYLDMQMVLVKVFRSYDMVWFNGDEGSERDSKG